MENSIGDIHNVGDIMYDSILLARKLGENRGNPVAEGLSLKPNEYNLVTLHRQENVDDRQRLEAVIAHILEHSGDLPIVFPIHPRTAKQMDKFDMPLDSFIRIEPVGYLDMVMLLQDANCIFTDSGGLQKEAYFCDTRCVTLRDETEWVETVETGHNRLWTTPDFKPLRQERLYGDGNAAGKIVSIVESFLSQ